MAEGTIEYSKPTDYRVRKTQKVFSAATIYISNKEYVSQKHRLGNYKSGVLRRIIVKTGKRRNKNRGGRQGAKVKIRKIYIKRIRKSAKNVCERRTFVLYFRRIVFASKTVGETVYRHCKFRKDKNGTF